MIATSYYYDSTTATGYIDYTCTSGTFYGGNHLRLVVPLERPSYYCRGLAFETEKLAKAFENTMLSREVSQRLSFLDYKCVYRPPNRVIINKSTQSLKQKAYNKRKKFKEKLGLKH